MSNTAENFGYLVKGAMDAAAARGVMTDQAKEVMVNGIMQIWRTNNPTFPILSQAEYEAAQKAKQAEGGLAPPA